EGLHATDALHPDLIAFSSQSRRQGIKTVKVLPLMKAFVNSESLDPAANKMVLNLLIEGEDPEVIEEPLSTQ
ncbi:MAG: hypothetical protein ACRC9V_11870, partial [Aeromonas sp.]